MSFKRDRDQDCRKTLEVIAGGSHVDETDQSKNWLGHSIGSGGSKIDEMLVKGVTREQLEEQAGRGAINNHLSHLRRDHGIPVLNEDGIVLFDRRALEEMAGF